MTGGFPSSRAGPWYAAAARRNAMANTGLSKAACGEPSTGTVAKSCRCNIVRGKSCRSDLLKKRRRRRQTALLANWRILVGVTLSDELNEISFSSSLRFEVGAPASRAILIRQCRYWLQAGAGKACLHVIAPVQWPLKIQCGSNKPARGNQRSHAARAKLERLLA